MPLVAERAFGGPGHAENPVGRGIVALALGGATAVALPNIEDPSRLILRPEDRPEPAGFGPLHRLWAPRHAPKGTFDDVWLKAGGFPGLPVDFDLSYFQAAPPDQRIDGYFRGDEAVSLGNLDVELPHIATRLPGLRVRCFLRQSPAFGPAFREMQIQLDTVWIDTEARQISCIWRGIAEVRSRHYEELEKLLVVSEPLAEKPLPKERYTAETWWTRPAPEEPEEPAAPAPRPQTPPKKPPPVDAEVAAGMEEAHRLLARSNVPSDIRSKVAGVQDPDLFLAALLPLLAQEPGAMERLERETRKQLKALFQAHGQDPSVVDIPADTKEKVPEGPWTRERAVSHAAARGSFARQNLRDLDLSGLDASQLDFSGADFTRSSLEGAKLEGANLSNAIFLDADLRRATLRGTFAREAVLSRAHLQQADLSYAVFAQARLNEADLAEAKLDASDFSASVLTSARMERSSLNGTVFEGAQLGGAVLREARGENTIFARSDLSDADVRKASFFRADFALATLDRARFTGATLEEATFHGSRGQGLSMAGANLTSIRAGDGASWIGADMQKIRADESIWNDTDLSGSNLSEASLVRAVFAGARAERATFSRAVAKQVDFSRAALAGASFIEANLFQSRFERADLTDSDFSRANLYGCELLDATLVRATFEGANVKSTKLSG